MPFKNISKEKEGMMVAGKAGSRWARWAWWTQRWCGTRGCGRSGAPSQREMNVVGRGASKGGTDLMVLSLCPASFRCSFSLVLFSPLCLPPSTPQGGLCRRNQRAGAVRVDKSRNLSFTWLPFHLGARRAFLTILFLFVVSNVRFTS